METTTVRRTLRYKFTQKECVDLGRELSLKNQEKRNLDAQKSSTMAEYNSRIKTAEEQISLLSDKVSSGYETREIACELRYHWPERNKKTYTRTDTNEEWTEPMVDTDFNLFNQWEEKEQKRIADEEAQLDLFTAAQIASDELNSEFNQAENEAA